MRLRFSCCVVAVLFKVFPFLPEVDDLVTQPDDSLSDQPDGPGPDGPGPERTEEESFLLVRFNEPVVDPD